MEKLCLHNLQKDGDKDMSKKAEVSKEILKFLFDEVTSFIKTTSELEYSDNEDPKLNVITKDYNKKLLDFRCDALKLLDKVQKEIQISKKLFYSLRVYRRLKPINECSVKYISLLQDFVYFRIHHADYLDEENLSVIDNTLIKIAE